VDVISIFAAELFIWQRLTNLLVQCALFAESLVCIVSLCVDVDGVIKVQVVDGKLQVKARRSALEQTRRLKPMAAFSASVKTKVLIIGGG